MANSAFNFTTNPRVGKRERIAVGAGVSQLTQASYTLDRTLASSLDGGPGMLPLKWAVTAVLQVVGADSIYWTLDGTAPSGTVGFKSDPGDFIYLDTTQKIKEFRVIQANTATSLEAMYGFE